MSRYLTVEEVAAFVRFLCGPDGRFITGQNIYVDGGSIPIAFFRFSYGTARVL